MNRGGTFGGMKIALTESMDAHDPATWPEWLLLRVVWEIATVHCGGAEEAAGYLILEYANRGHFRRWGGSSNAVPDRGPINPIFWGTVNGNVSYPVDLINSRVAYVCEPISPYGTMGVVEEMLSEGGYLPEQSRHETTLVRLHRDDVASMLRAAGLLLPEPAFAILPRPKSGTERWVYDRMKSDPPWEDEEGYAEKIYPDCPNKNAGLKTIQNYVANYRKQFQRRRSAIPGNRSQE